MRNKKIKKYKIGDLRREIKQVQCTIINRKVFKFVKI